MNNKGFICRNCKNSFVVPDIYNEKHSLDSPPYEQVEVCPNCFSGDFFEFNFYVEKTEIAEKILPIILMLNRHINSIKDIFGTNVKNDDLQGSVSMLSELVSEMFDFLPTEIDRKILNVNSQKQCDYILMNIRGDI